MLSVSCSRCAFPFRVTRKRRVILLPIRIYIYIYSSPRGSSISRIIPLFSPLAFHSFRSSYFFSPVVVSSPLPVSTLYFPTCTRHRYFNDRGGTFIPSLAGYRRMRNFKDETRARLVHYFLSKCFRYFVRVTTRNQIFSNFSSFRIDEIDGGIEKSCKNPFPYSNFSLVLCLSHF